MRKRIALTSFLFFTIIFCATSTTFYSNANGNWNSTSTWNPSGVPSKTDYAIISHTVTLTQNEDIKYLDIDSGGTLQGNYDLFFWNNGSIQVDGTMNIKSIDLKNVGLGFTVNASGEITLSGDLYIINNNITCHGNIVVGGTLSAGIITGTGSITANVYNTGTVFGITPVDGATYYGQCWHGGTSGHENSWETAANWASGAIPSSSTNVFISSGNNLPIISSHATCNSLVVEQGASLIIYPLSSLSISGDVTNNGTITLKSDSSGTASLIDNGNLTNNGYISIERYNTSGGYHYISSPVNNSPASVFAGTTIYAYDETNTDTNRNVGWAAVSTSTDTLTNGCGYAIFHNSNSTNTFTGNLNTGNISFTATRTNSGSAANPSPDGWNILGNPYPSAISASSFIAANSDLTGTLYFWSDDGTNGSGFTTSDYATYTTSGGVGASGGGSATAPDGKIAVGQGFFAQVKSGVCSTSVSFTNSMRQTNTTQFYTPTSEIQSFRLDLRDEAGNQNEILISFINEATQGFDQNYDGVKMQGNPYLSLYTIIKDYNLIIQGLPYIKEDVFIPIGYYAGMDGKYTFERFEFENFGDDIYVYLEDKLTGQFVDILRNSIYTFNSDAGTFDNRFVLHFERRIVNSLTSSMQAELAVYSNNSTIYIKNPKLEKGIVAIYNLAGEKIYERMLNKESLQSIQLKKLTGIYLVCIENETEKISKKIILE